MISRPEHLLKAYRNEEFAVAVSALPTRRTEWEVTAWFYSALHFVGAFLAGQGRHPKTHQERRQLVRELTGVRREYEYLFQSSLAARYDFVEFSPERVEQLRTRYFQPVKTEMLQRLPP